MAYRKYIVGAIFHCDDCGKDFQDYKTAQKEAYQHSVKCKHTVRGEITHFVTYDNSIKEPRNDD